MNEKLKSRKFIVWLTGTVLVIGSLIASTITNNNTLAEVSKTFADGWVILSGVYMGANAVSKFGNKNSEANNEVIER